MKTVRMMIFFVVGLQFVLAGSSQLKNFRELMDALKTGESVRVVIHYGKCELVSNNQRQDRSPDAIGGMNLDTFEWFAEKLYGNETAFVVASESKLIENPKGEGYVYNYAKIRVYADNRVRIIARYIDPLTMEELMDESFYSKINDEQNDGAVFFYRQK